MALVKGAFELAEGIAASIFNPPAAAKHFAAAKVYFATAAIAGALGAAIGAAGGLGGAGAGAGGGEGGAAGQFGGEPPADRTFSRGNVEGLIGGFREVIQPLINEQRAGFEEVVRVQQQGIEQQIGLDAAIDRLAEAAGVFGEAGRRLQAIRAGEFIAVAEAENPEAFARATARGAERSNSANQRLSEALNLHR